MKETKIIIDNKNAVIMVGKKQYTDAFSGAINVSISENTINPINSLLNFAYVSPNIYKQIGGVCYLFCQSSGEKIELFLLPSESLVGNKIQVTSTIYSKFNCSEESDFYLLRYCFALFNKVKTQKIDKIKEDNIVVSKKTIDSMIPDYQTCKYRLFSLHNTSTGENIIIKKKHIVIDDSLPEGVIRISRIQRIFLGFELRDYIPDLVWTQLQNNLQIDSKDWQLITSAYDEKSRIVKNNISFNEKNEVKKIINKFVDSNLILCPVIESLNNGARRNLLLKLSDFYVGKSTISLTCKRPYEIDEGKDIIRLSENNMNLLGITSMDQVRVTYKNKTVKCRVLELEEKESFKKTNLPMSADIVAGIPINLRKKLGILNIDSCVKIDRDTPFIFRKNINEQIIPILLTLFSSNFISDFSVWKTAIISLIAVPIVVYFNLSSKRNMRLK
ncbi:MAG: hypothetical protein ACI31G_03460 [Bacilli bacterium]